MRHNCYLPGRMGSERRSISAEPEIAPCVGAATGIAAALARPASIAVRMAAVLVTPGLLLTLLIRTASAAPPVYQVLEFSTPGPHVGQTFQLQKEFPNHPELPSQVALLEIPARKRQAFEAALQPAGQVVGLYEKIGPLRHADGAQGFGRYSLVVLSNPVSAARERAYNDWYDHQHVPDVLRVPGFKSAQRFKLASNETPSAFVLPAYAVRFTFDSEDVSATIAEVKRRLAAGITRPSADFDSKTSVVRYYAPD
jgi:hypothetical protein